MTELEKDFVLDIATAPTRMARKWKNRKWTWGTLVERCSRTQRTAETVGEYMKMSREEQSGVKDVGGFVGGYLSGGLRKNGCVMWRSMATLDVDYGEKGMWKRFREKYQCAALIYSTHKHTADKPRYRLVVPFRRNVTPYEYEAVCRRLAEAAGINAFDISTYQLPRLFYWPSTSRDGDYVFKVWEGEPCDPDEILATYVDYRDASQWPVSDREGDTVLHEIKVAGDPVEKPGLIGAFCRAYGIEEAIEAFLGEYYAPAAVEGRYTYKKGSVAAGLVCYSGKYAYSHHETDPAGRRLCNAFDLCRIHLFGVHDEGSQAKDVTRLPSYAKMQELAAKDKRVCALVAREKVSSAAEDFDGIDVGAVDIAGVEWAKDLKLDKNGDIKPSAFNIELIMENDPNISGRLWLNQFTGYRMVEGALPWKREGDRWTDSDAANMRVYLDKVYGLASKDKIKDAVTVAFSKRGRHPIREYLSGLVWDGVERLDRLVVDYLGAEDDELTRAMTRKHFTAAVARVMQPGIKYDYCMIVTGEEGIGKSTLFNVMGGEWFNDSVTTMEGKNGMEQLRGAWVIELSELGSIKRSDVEQVKAFITRRDDVYRGAYKEESENHPRQCVFCGTTNEEFFLKGDTGNRRFWVIKVDEALRTKDMDDLMADRDQLWAEAVVRWKQGEKLYLTKELEKEAKGRQKAFNDNSDDPVKSQLEVFLAKKIPADWDTWDKNRRAAYYLNPDPLDEVGTVTRDRVCAMEFLCEGMGKKIDDKESKYLMRKISGLLRDLGWEGPVVSRHAEAMYGRQKTYLRPSDNPEDDDL